jgi:hypothetical protein
MSLDDILSNSNILNNAAHNAAQYDKLSTFYRLSEKYGKGGVKNLENGRFSPKFLTDIIEKGVSFL